MTELNRSVTDRGFVTYDEFTDTYGTDICVRQSSTAAGPRVWIFASHDPAKHLTPQDRARLWGLDTLGMDELAAKLTPSPHLDVEQAKRVRDALDEFIKDHGGDQR